MQKSVIILHYITHTDDYNVNKLNTILADGSASRISTQSDSDILSICEES